MRIILFMKDENIEIIRRIPNIEINENELNNPEIAYDYPNNLTIIPWNLVKRVEIEHD